MQLNNYDLLLINGDFLTAKLPPDKAWLLKCYKKKPLLIKKFLVYYVTFCGSEKPLATTFVDHTGVWCRYKDVHRMGKHVRMLEALMEKAIEERDYKKVAELKVGKYKTHPPRKNPK